MSSGRWSWPQIFLWGIGKPLNCIKSDGISRSYGKTVKISRAGQIPGKGFGRTNSWLYHCFIIHQILTLEKRFSYYETIGEVFKGAQEEACILTLWERILAIIYRMINEYSLLCDEGNEVQINQTIFASFIRKEINQETHKNEIGEKINI